MLFCIHRVVVLLLPAVRAVAVDPLEFEVCVWQLCSGTALTAAIAIVAATAITIVLR